MPPNENQEPKLLSTNFNIINLTEAINIVNSLDELGLRSAHYFDPKNGLETKKMETLLSSPVFYNTCLLPNAKYKYVSTFKRSQFTDKEKMLDDFPFLILIDIS